VGRGVAEGGDWQERKHNETRGAPGEGFSVGHKGSKQPGKTQPQHQPDKQCRACMPSGDAGSGEQHGV